MQKKLFPARCTLFDIKLLISAPNVINELILTFIDMIIDSIQVCEGFYSDLCYLIEKSIIVSDYSYMFYFYFTVCQELKQETIY